MDEEVEEKEPQVIISTEADFDERLRTLGRLTGSIKTLDEDLKSLKVEAEALSYGLAHYMLSSGCSSKVLDGVVYKQKQRIFSKVEDKEALRSWIVQNDAVDLLMAVHPSKLTAYCNEQLEAGGATPTGVNPSFIKYFVDVKLAK